MDRDGEDADCARVRVPGTGDRCAGPDRIPGGMSPGRAARQSPLGKG